MVSVSKLKSVIEHIALTAHKKIYAAFPLLWQKWRTLDELIYILKIPYNATISLQRRDFTLSDTFGIWIGVKLHLKKVVDAKISKTKLDITMLNKLDSRNECIFEHPAMKAAIYLDPRYRRVVTQSQTSVDAAKVFLLSLHRRLEFLKNRSANEIATETDLSGDLNDSFGIEFDREAAMNEFLGHTSQNIKSQSCSDFEAELDLFDPPVMGINDSVLEFWTNNNTDVMLRDVALAVYAIPPTETEVERDFSALKFIFSDLRSGLSNKTLENILCIHLNKDIYLTVNEREINKLQKPV